MAYYASDGSSASSSYYYGVIQKLKNQKIKYTKLKKDLDGIYKKLDTVYTNDFYYAMSNLIEGYQCNGETIRQDVISDIDLKLESNKNIIDNIRNEVNNKIINLDNKISTYTIYYNNALNRERKIRENLLMN